MANRLENGYCESLTTWYCTKDIDVLVKKVISTRSLDLKSFDRQLKKLMDEVYHAGYNEGTADTQLRILGND